MNICILRSSASPVAMVEEAPVVPSPQRRSANDCNLLPVIDPRVALRKKEDMRRAQLSEKWVHVSPVVVFLCLFILWWFYHPVSLEMNEDGSLNVLLLRKD